MKGKVILILCEGNAANLCSIAAEDYPGGKPPAVGDLVPLRAKRTFRVTVGEGEKSESKELEATYLDGLYEVKGFVRARATTLTPKHAAHRSTRSVKISRATALPLNGNACPSTAR